jgi:hypothetical protein
VASEEARIGRRANAGAVPVIEDEALLMRGRCQAGNRW